MARTRTKALVWLLRPAGTSGVEVLVLERPAHRGGGFHPVTGKADKDEPPAQAARREAREETGLDGEVHDLRWSHSFEGGSRGGSWVEHAWLLPVPDEAQVKLSNEHVSARWLAPHEARARLEWAAHRHSLELALQAFAELRETAGKTGSKE